MKLTFPYTTSMHGSRSSGASSIYNCELRSGFVLKKQVTDTKLSKIEWKRNTMQSMNMIYL